MTSERANPPRHTNAVEQCGRLVGYAVKDEDGQTILVDEHGVPARKDQAHRRPVPPAFDEDGRPRWAC